MFRLEQKNLITLFITIRIDFISLSKKIRVFLQMSISLGYTVAQMVKNLPTMQENRFEPWVGKISWRREWLSTPVFLLGKPSGQRNLAGYSPWGHKESDMTERLTLSLLSITEYISVISVSFTGLRLHHQERYFYTELRKERRRENFCTYGPTIRNGDLLIPI